MDWMNIPMDEFHGVMNPTTGRCEHLHGQNVSTEIMRTLEVEIGGAFEKYMPDDDETFEKYEMQGLVPVLRDGQWQDEERFSLTLADLPVILDTLIVLEEEQQKLKKEERRKRSNARARERRKLIKLGEW